MNVCTLNSSGLADLAGISTRKARAALKQGLEGGLWRGASLCVEWQNGRGGKEMAVRVGSLPKDLQVKWAKENLSEGADDAAASGHTPNRAVSGPPVSKKPEPVERTMRPSAAEVEAAAAAWARKTDQQKAKGERRSRALFAVEKLQADGLTKSDAVTAVAQQQGVTETSIWNWFKKAAGWPRDAWRVVLTDHYSGRQKSVEICDEAWDYILADYLRAEAPALTAVYDRALLRFELPSYKTVERRIKELPATVRVLARDGVEALERLYPHQERDRSWYGALEAVNADGHKFDVFVQWPDGEICRPIMAGWQDIFSGKMLSYDITKTENTDTIRTSFGLMVREFGIPEHAYLDNGRGFASKWLTGGAPTRYRFKVKEDEPMGILTQMGVQTHWCTPYHGQAKPIERAFRDLCCERIAKHPVCAGAYTGNNPLAKPENYGSKAVPLAQFKALVAEQVAAHNARAGRRTKVCAGRSFDEVFAESYEGRKAEIRKPMEDSLAYLLMQADTVKVYRAGSYVRYAGNRYYHEALVEHGGEKVAIRFDPERMHSGILVYTLCGRLICRAGCVAATGFGDRESAREHAKEKNRFKRSVKEQLKAVRKMDALEAVIPNITADDEGTTVVRIDGGEKRLAALRSAAPAEEREPVFDGRFPARNQKPKSEPAQREDEFDELVAAGLRRTAGVGFRREVEADPAEMFWN